MLAIRFISTIFITLGILMICKVSIVEILVDFENYFRNRKVSVKDKVNLAKMKKKPNSIQKMIIETKAIMKITNKDDKFILIVIISLSSSVLGMFIGSYLNIKSLMIVLGVGFALIPFWYIKFASLKWKKDLNQELETGLSLITSSYIRTENIIYAIEENINYLNTPIKEIFEMFLFNTTSINSNTKKALEELKYKVDNDVFSEWIDAMISCQDDKSLKTVLPPITNKLSDMRVVSAELDNITYAPTKDFFLMSVLVILAIPILRLLSVDLYNQVMYTKAGNIVLTFSTILFFIAVAGVIRISKPIEYKR